MPLRLPVVLLAVATLVSSASATDLPLKQVVLFSSGVGYFHREGNVEGRAAIELSFRTEQINDLLKSLVLQDYDGGTIAPVTYAPREPIERTLSSFAIDISDNPSLDQLIDRLRGIEVEVKSDTTRTGTIVGVETQQKSVGDSILAFQVVNLLTDDGIVEVPIWQMKSLRLLDGAVDTDLKKALDVLATTRDVQKRSLTLNFAGTGVRRVSAGYLLETPVWKTTYRLVVDGDEMRLQGWAIVENTTDDDWDAVRLVLVSGQPVSFVQSLYEPLYIPRPVLPPSVTPAARPRSHEGAIEAFGQPPTTAAPSEPLAEAERAGGRDLAARGQMGPQGPTGPAGPGGMMGPGMMGGGMGGGGYGAGYGGYGGYGGGMVGGIAAEALAQAMASGAAVGELFQYAIDQPVTIARKESAMIPIVNAPIDGEKVSVYNASVDDRHPMNGIQLKNTTGLNLSPGAVTVFDGGAYAGDALIEALSPGDDRLITYATDLDVEVEKVEQMQPEQVVAVKIAHGTAIVTRKQRQETRFTAKSVADASRTLLIEHPYRTDWELVEPKELDERTQSLYRFRVALEPKATAKLSVVEEHPVSQEVVLTDAAVDEVALILESSELTDAVKAALQKVVEMKTALADVRREIADRNARLDEIKEEQSRIRQNMQQLDRNSELYKRYVEKFTAQEDEYEKLQLEIDGLHDQEKAMQKQLEDYLLGLDIE